MQAESVCPEHRCRSLSSPQPSSPVAILVGAGISTQVENEKALGELVCTAERMGSHACSVPHPPRETSIKDYSKKQEELGAKRRDDHIGHIPRARARCPT